jgi:hypothetical protein
MAYIGGLKIILFGGCINNGPTGTTPLGEIWEYR